MKKTVGLYTLGCKVSQYETEAIEESFIDRGYEIRPFAEKNDVYVINTCTVTAESDRKCRQMIRRAARSNPNGKIIVLGCYSQRSADEVAAIAGVDAVIGSADKLSSVNIASRLLSGLTPFEGTESIINVKNIDDEPFEPMCIRKGNRTRVYVKIEDGCECKCTYCAIPSARGRVRSKPMDDVIAEVRALTESGVPEVVLTGIETGSYGADFESRATLADLLVRIDEEKAAKRIRLGSLAPELVGEEFCAKIKGLITVAPHFHISIQSGSDAVLRRMKRRYSRAMALENIKRLKENIPGATFTTDLMVGFPGESEEDFLATVSFVKEVGFLDCHVFAYSKRKNTEAQRFADQISEELKHQRSDRLIKVCAEQRARVLDGIIECGAPLSVIFESFENGKYKGHSDAFVCVEVPAGEDDLCSLTRMVKPISHNGEVVLGEII